jgi:TonB family protein
MSSEERNVSANGGKDAERQDRQRSANILRDCLMDGDAEAARREAKVRRRALVISTLLQAAVVAAVIAVPFLGRVERIALANVTPMPPYRPLGNALGNAAHEQPIRTNPQSGGRRTICFLCPVGHPVNHSPAPNAGDAHEPDGAMEIEGGGDPTGPCPGCIHMASSEGPRPPEIPTTPARILKVTHLDPAMLIERIEPVYPSLAQQIRREAQVEMHAIISTEGRIESLEVVGGDRLFYQSALDAVRRWRYRATFLNGRAVEVDTYITVIYTLR